MVLLFAAVALLLVPGLSEAQSPQCSSALAQFNVGSIQAYCQAIQQRFNDSAYRITDISPAEINQICSDAVCVSALQQLTIPCNVFVSNMRIL